MQSVHSSNSNVGIETDHRASLVCYGSLTANTDALKTTVTSVHPSNKAKGGLAIGALKEDRYYGTVSIVNPHAGADLSDDRGFEHAFQLHKQETLPRCVSYMATVNMPCIHHIYYGTVSTVNPHAGADLSDNGVRSSPVRQPSDSL